AVLRQGHEVVDLEFGPLVADATGEQQRAEAVLGLQQRREALVRGRRHPAQVAGQLALFGGVADEVQPQRQPERQVGDVSARPGELATELLDRKSTRLNSSHVKTSYAVFCLKKKKPMA